MDVSQKRLGTIIPVFKLHPLSCFSMMADIIVESLCLPVPLCSNLEQLQILLNYDKLMQQNLSYSF